MILFDSYTDLDETEVGSVSEAILDEDDYGDDEDEDSEDEDDGDDYSDDEDDE